LAEQSEGSSSSLLIVAPALEGRIFHRAPATACLFREGKERDDMTIRLWTHRTDGGRSRYRSSAAQWPHVGECAFVVLCMVKQRDSGRVSAAGDAR